MTKINAAAELWLKDLESGTFQKGTGELFNKNSNCYCVLGVAAQRVHPPEQQSDHPKYDGVVLFDGQGFRATDTMVEVLGLINNEGIIITPRDLEGNPASTGIRMGEVVVPSLLVMNDETNLTLPEIAALIRANADLIFV